MKRFRGLQNVIALVLVFSMFVTMNAPYAKAFQSTEEAEMSGAGVVYNGYVSPDYNDGEYPEGSGRENHRFFLTYRDDEAVYSGIRVLGSFGARECDFWETDYQMVRGPYDMRFFEFSLNHMEPGTYQYKFQLSDGTIINDPANPNTQDGSSIITIEGLKISNAWSRERTAAPYERRALTMKKGDVMALPGTATKYERDENDAPVVSTVPVTYSLHEGQTATGIELTDGVMKVSPDYDGGYVELDMTDGDKVEQIYVVMVKRVKVHYYDPEGQYDNLNFWLEGTPAEGGYDPEYGRSQICDEVDELGRTWKTGYVDMMDDKVSDQAKVFAATSVYPHNNATWIGEKHNITFRDKKAEVWFVKNNCSTFDCWPRDFSEPLVMRNSRAATCTMAGYTGDAYCARCGEYRGQGETIPVISHDWDEGVVTKAPTTTQDGTKVCTCKRCQAKQEVLVPKLTLMVEPKTGLSTGTKIKDDAKKATYVVTDSVNHSVTYQKPVSKKLKSIQVPKSVTIAGEKYKVTAIAKKAFAGCKSLKKVLLSNAISKIGEKAFYGCSKLKRIKVSNKSWSKKTIGKNAFGKIAKKAVFDVPNSCKKSYKKILKASGAGSKSTVK